MCKCCANRIEAHGDGVGGAGPLPPLQMTDGEDARSNSIDSRAGMTRDRRERATARSETPPASGKNRAPVSPPRQARAKRRREEEPPTKRRGPTTPEGEFELIQEETEEPAGRRCRNCGRHTRGDFAVCCEACYKTGGRADTEACDAWNKRISKPPPDYRRDGPEGDDDDSDYRMPGEGLREERKEERRAKERVRLLSTRLTTSGPETMRGGEIGSDQERKGPRQTAGLLTTRR